MAFTEVSVDVYTHEKFTLVQLTSDTAVKPSSVNTTIVYSIRRLLRSGNKSKLTKLYLDVCLEPSLRQTWFYKTAKDRTIKKVYTYKQLQKRLRHFKKMPILYKSEGVTQIKSMQCAILHKKGFAPKGYVCIKKVLFSKAVLALSCLSYFTPLTVEKIARPPCNTLHVLTFKMI